MKKIIAIMLLLCLCVGLCACASMDKFEENLGSKYKTKDMDEEDMEPYAERLGLDADDYDIQSAIQATHKKKGTGVAIIECGSKSKAEELAEDAQDMPELLQRQYGTNYSFDIVTEGRFVLVGEDSAIEDALGE